jgi:hypothetical protein
MTHNRNIILRSGAMAMVLTVLGVGAFANHMGGGDMDAGHAWFSGAVSSISPSSLSVQGVPVALDTNTVLVGVDGSGNLIPLTPGDFHPGDMVAVFAESNSGSPLATSLFRGFPFMIQGYVTAFQADSQGHPLTVTIDDTFTVFTAQAQMDAMGMGNMQGGMGGDMGGGMMNGGCMGSGMGGGMGGGMDGCPGMGGGMGNTPPVQVAVGSRVAFGGIVQNGTFTAVFGHVMEVSTQQRTRESKMD